MKSGWMRSHSVILVIFLAIISWPEKLTAQSDPIVIRGAEGSEQRDVRLGQQHHGPVTRRDTLWSIANQYRPHSGVTLQQTMAAIMHANPQAFPTGNPNEMESGYFLRIPSLQEIQMVNPEAARRQIELGESLQQSQRQLAQTQQQTTQSAQQQNEILAQARLRAEQAVGEVRAAYMQEINELRERMRDSIDNTEAAFQQNEALRERVDRIADALDEIQRNMVNEQEFQQQLRGVLEQQDELRLQQETSRNLAESQTALDRMLANPWMIALLAFIPALFMIIVATLLLRRRDSHEQTLEPVSKGATATGAAGVAAAGNEPQLLDEGSDDFELDDAMADFDQLDDDEDGDDLSALEDEMLVPDEADEEGIQLDEDTDEMDFDAFTSPEDDDLKNDAAEPDSNDENDDEEPVTNDEAADDGDLSQSDLDALLAESEEDAGEDTETIADAADDSEGEDTEDEEESDAIDFDALMEEFGAGDEDDSIDDEDIDALLARSEELVAEQPREEETRGEQERPADVEEAEELEANEELEFDDEDTAESEDDFIDIDDILNEADDEPEDIEEEDDEADREAARRADEEDNLAAQLDLARAYLEMEEVDEARETVQAVIEEAEGELLEEAKALLERIES